MPSRPRDSTSCLLTRHSRLCDSTRLVLTRHSRLCDSARRNRTTPSRSRDSTGRDRTTPSRSRNRDSTSRAIAAHFPFPIPRHVGFIPRTLRGSTPGATSRPSRTSTSLTTHHRAAPTARAQPSIIQTGPTNATITRQPTGTTGVPPVKTPAHPVRGLDHHSAVLGAHHCQPEVGVRQFRSPGHDRVQHPLRVVPGQCGAGDLRGRGEGARGECRVHEQPRP